MGWRAEYRGKAQAAYGGYCQKARSLGCDPIPYYRFTDLYETRTVKQIVKELHENKEGSS
ncbi:hypothetical protein Z3_111 [Bacillus phage Z3]|nr:hypothetical protein Z3_111 [Bacillus phage Z3]